MNSLKRSWMLSSSSASPRLLGRVGTFWEMSEPSDNSGNLYRGGVGVGGRYVITEWSDVDLSYDYERRNGPDLQSYGNHRVVLGVTFYLNALRPQARRTRPK